MKTSTGFHELMIKASTLERGSTVEKMIKKRQFYKMAGNLTRVSGTTSYWNVPLSRSVARTENGGRDALRECSTYLGDKEGRWSRIRH